VFAYGLRAYYNVPMSFPTLDRVVSILEGLEETIVLKLIDRVQFCANSPAYESGQSGFNGSDGISLFMIRLRYQEEMDAVFGRYLVPEERPFFKDLPEPKRNVTLPNTGLSIKDLEIVNIAPKICSAYLDHLSLVCLPGDDGQYGSSVEHDVLAVQAISRRIHYGALYVAENKYRADPEGYSNLVLTGDRAAIMEKLTRPEVEDRILLRVEQKVEYMQREANRGVRVLIDPDKVLTFYRDHVIPLTKEGEVLYLLNRPG
jgi:chorismate mutase